MSNLIVYKASAGSGKTFRLAAEYIKLVIHDPQSYKRILAVTFTNKATAEMKGRILEELKGIADGKKSPMFALICEETRINPDTVTARASKALSNILHDYSRFSVSTIDSFVQRIIQALLWEIGQQGGGDIRLDFKPVLERAADIMLDESVDNPGLFKWLQSMGESQLEAGKSWDIRSGLVNLGRELFSESFRLLSHDEIIAITDKEKVNALKKELNGLIGNISGIVIGLGKDTLKVIGEYGFSEKDFAYGSSGVYGFFEKCADMDFGELLPKLDGTRVQKALDSPSGEDWVTAADRKNAVKFAQISGLISGKLHPALAKLYDTIGENEPQYNSARLVLKNLDSLAILSDLWQTIRKLSTEEGFMLLADSGPLLREFVKETDAPFVYEKVGTRFDSFMIDEFQDTSVIQWQNFKPLIENSLAQGSFSMVVGDVKQAIYRWRNGDWRILSSGLEVDFASLGITHKPLDVNRRSLPAVIDFNNLFFTSASLVLKALTEEMVTGTNLDSDFGKEFSLAYDNVVQKKSKKDEGEGYVEVNFLPNEDKSFNENLKNYLPDLISDIQKRGYKAGDIAILVRSNKDGQDLANILLSHKQTNPETFGSFDVVSQEGLLLVSSPAIRLCVAAIRATYQPKDSITKACLAAGLRTIDGNSKVSWHQLFTGEALGIEVEWLKGFRTRPVQEVFEAIIKRYGLLNSKKELAYISELHEQILNLSRKGPNDVGRFLEWWDEDGIKLALTMPDSENAVTITTIHKSKGLQFPVVIIPHGDWPFNPPGMRPLLWVESAQKPFDILPKYPINSGKDSKSSYFAKSAIEDDMQVLVDNINLLYVAFTRAENELYVFCPQKKEDSKILSTSPLMKSVLSAIDSSEFVVDADRYGDSAISYSRGKRDIYKNQKTKGGNPIWILENYPAGETKANVKQRLESTDFFSESSASYIQSINYGKLMHTLFSRIAYSSDIDNALNSMQLEGLINMEQKELLKGKMEQLLIQEPYSSWFSDEWQIKNEASVITPEGSTYRPDRVMIKANEVVIVDYKFGAESESYHKQIRRYSSLIQKMGYERVDGYLWYVDSGRLVRVGS
ncbi:MAG: UvrD-helicase domain-containing protein [Bacteroidales bacterium]|nr:UvrD-helicase domain-containing protein [Bacteroidales bacterium]